MSTTAENVLEGLERMVAAISLDGPAPVAVFRGNDDLRPILLYEGFSGHPLRKDYPKQLEQPLVPYRPPQGTLVR